jgi:uncharacterized protein (DUF1330 family)
MTAYLALTQKVNDLDKYQETYIPQVRPVLEKYGIEVLVAHFGATAIEGAQTASSSSVSSLRRCGKPSTKIPTMQI